jgi:hypothetical protein
VYNAYVLRGALTLFHKKIHYLSKKENYINVLVKPNIQFQLPDLTSMKGYEMV